jgi:hypothetical protein
MTGTPYLTVSAAGDLILTVPPEELQVCPKCPDLHVRVFADATPANLRRFAVSIIALAERIEKVARR